MATEKKEPIRLHATVEQTRTPEKTATSKLAEQYMATVGDEKRDSRSWLQTMCEVVRDATDDERRQVVAIAEGIWGEDFKDLQNGEDEREWLVEVVETGKVNSGDFYNFGYQKLVNMFDLDPSDEDKIVATARLVNDLIQPPADKTFDLPPEQYVAADDESIRKSQENLSEARAGYYRDKGGVEIIPTVGVAGGEEFVEGEVVEIVDESDMGGGPVVEDEPVVTPERDWRGEYETLRSFGGAALDMWLAENIGRIPADLRDEIAVGRRIEPTTIEIPIAVEAELNIEDVRNKFLEQVMEEIGYNGGRLRYLEKDDVKAILKDIGAPESFDKEANALISAMNISVVKHHFMDNIVTFFPLIDKEKQESAYDPDVERARIYREGYSDGKIELLLKSIDDEDRQLVNKALKIFSAIGENLNEEDLKSRLESLLGRELTDVESRSLGRFAGIYEKGTKDLRKENEMVTLASSLLRGSEYISRIGFILFEALVEPDINSRHPDFALTHTNLHADNMRAAGIWWGSAHWWDEEFSRSREGRARNALPGFLMKAGIGNETDLRDIIKSVDGDAVRYVLGMTREGKFSGLHLKLQSAIRAHVKLTEISPSTEGEKLTAESLWSLRKALLGISGEIDDETSSKTMVTATKIFFKELSTEGVAAHKNEGKTLRMRTPNGLFQRFVYVALRRPGDTGMSGLFDFGTVRDDGSSLREIRGKVLRYMNSVPKNLIPQDERRDLTGGSIYNRFLPQNYIDSGAGELIIKMAKTQW